MSARRLPPFGACFDFVREEWDSEGHILCPPRLTSFALDLLRPMRLKNE